MQVNYFNRFIRKNFILLKSALQVCSALFLTIGGPIIIFYELIRIHSL